MIRVLSCNIRYSRADDGENSWIYRKEICRDAIRSRDAHIICFQEMTPEQFGYLKSKFPRHDACWILNEPKDGEPVNAIFYRKDAFLFESAGGYWLSETPHIAGSRSWQSDCIRLANWVLLTDKRSGRQFRLINTHLDHVSQKARENQARLINEDAAAYDTSFPQVLTGDMNADRNNPAIRMFKDRRWKDTLELICGDREHGYTGHKFLGAGLPNAVQGRIDWVFVRGEIRVKSAEIVKDSIDGRYPSDHYFLSSEIDLP